MASGTYEMTYEILDVVVAYIERRDKVLSRTSSGGVTVNDEKAANCESVLG